MTNSKSISVGICEARTRFSELLARVERGHEVVITRNGSPVARLVPTRKRTTYGDRHAAIKRWLRISKGITLGRLRLRGLIAEGRP